MVGVQKACWYTEIEKLLIHTKVLIYSMHVQSFGGVQAATKNNKVY